MQKINFSLIKEIQDKADIVAVISSFIKLNRKGNNYISLCPFHADKNPSLVVSPKKKIFKCFVCGAKGNVFGFVQQYKKVPFLEAVHIVAQLINFDDSQLQANGSNTYLDPKIKRLFDANKQANEWYQGFLHNSENSEQLTYLTRRGLTADIIKEFEFGYAPNGKDQIYRMLSNANDMFGTNRSKEIVWSEKELLDAGLICMTTEGQVYDFFNDRITIPVYDNNGYLAAFSGRTTKNADPKYLNTSTTPIFSKNTTLFNFYKAKQIVTDKIIVVEGFMDAIAYVRAGYKNVVATMGVALSLEHLNALHTIPKLETVILSFDNDVAGAAATVEHGRKLTESGFNTFVVGPFDKKYKDVDELIKANGNSAIDTILDQRLDFITFLINNTFTNKKPIDEVQKDVNNIIQYMVECADSSILLRTQHLKLLAAKSNLEYEDLKDKFNRDLEKIISLPPKTTSYVNNSTRTYKPMKPSNEIGLKDTFLEKDDDQPVKRETINQLLEDLYHQQKIQMKKIAESYDNLIRNLIISPERISTVVDELFIENEFNIDEQRFILKAITVLHNRGLVITKESLLKYIDDQSKKETSVAKNYQRALAYLETLLENSIYKTFGKIMKGKHIEQAKELLHLIQTGKYNLLITNKLIEVWELTKKDPVVNRPQIDQLQIQIKAYHKLLSDLRKLK